MIGKDPPRLPKEKDRLEDPEKEIKRLKKELAL